MTSQVEQIWSQLITFSSQFVVPDWGSLVGLVPIMLLVLTFLYVTWTIYRFATAGPTRRGKHRMTPVAPPGVHMPGPSFAPLLAAFGCFMLVFGLVTGGFWLWIGLAVLGVTLLYWGREALRDYDHIPSASTALVTTGGSGLTAGAPLPPGALRAPEGTPPAGVHMPPPSFRPLLVAMAMTLLVAGLVVGGWALIFGFVALTVTLLEWLRDARREYKEVEDADRTGHLESGPAPAWPTATFAALALLLAGGLLLTSGLLPNSHTGEAAPSGAPAGGGGTGGSAAPPSAAPTLPAADTTITAQNTAFVETSVEAPAGKPFTIAFDNRDDGQQHNVAIHDASGAEVFMGKIVSGPTVIVYDVPALAAGTYSFVCSVHPNMTGTLTTK
jgi:plastocyanin